MKSQKFDNVNLITAMKPDIQNCQLNLLEF